MIMALVAQIAVSPCVSQIVMVMGLVVKTLSVLVLTAGLALLVMRERVKIIVPVIIHHLTSSAATRCLFIFAPHQLTDGIISL